MSTLAPTSGASALKLRVACALIVFIISLAVYSLTLAPTVTLVDSGELIVAAHSLGVAHPPGFPLYVMLAHLATLIPLGSVAVRVNFASAMFAALASSAVALTVNEALVTAGHSMSAARARVRSDRSKRGKRTRPPARDTSDAAPQSPLVLLISCMVSGLLLAFSRTLWGYATIAEVYTLTSLLILVIFLLMFRWRRGFIEAILRKTAASRLEDGKSGVNPDAVASSLNFFSPSAPTSPRSDRSLYAAAFVFGLALGVHHVSIGLMLPALALLVFATEGIRFFTSKRLAYAALFAFAGLFLVYAYLPIAASRSPIMNWGDPRTFERLWWQVTGKQYQVFFSFSLGTMASQFSGFIKLVAREFGPWWLPAASALAIAGFGEVFRRDRPVFWFLVLVIAADLGYSLGYEIADDKDAYYLPAFIALTIASGFGAQWFIKKVKSVVSARFASKPAGFIAAGLILLVPLVALAGNWSYDNRSRYFIAQDYVHNIFSTIEPGGMLLTRDWQVYSPMLYTNQIEHRRDDAIVIDVNQLRRSWYFDYLRTAYPATIELANDKVEAFLEDLRHWEQDPELYQRDLMLNQRINSRFYEMILTLVTNHIRSAPVYVTLDIAANRDGPDSELTKSLVTSYQLVPQGLVFQVTPDLGFKQPVDTQLSTRGLADETIKFDEDDVVTLKVLPVYVTMFYNRGRYLAANGQHDQAIEAFKQSLMLNPKFLLAQQAMNESVNAARRGSAPKTK